MAQAGGHAEARALYEHLTRWAPNRASTWAGLAQEVGAAPSDGMDAAAIAAALRRARELDPGEAKYRAELALRSKAPSLVGESRDDERYLVASPTILARRRGAATTTGGADAGPPDVADRQLHWLRAVVMHQFGRQVVTNRTARDRRWARGSQGSASPWDRLWASLYPLFSPLRAKRSGSSREVGCRGGD